MRPIVGVAVFAFCLLAVSSSIRAEDPGHLNDPGQLGQYAVGHTNYLLVDHSAADRPVIVSVWYPVDAGSVNSSTPLAQYPLDPWANLLPVSTSADWEAVGYDRAYEGPTPSAHGPFPLVMFSTGFGSDYFLHIFIGTRLASHGYVVAVTDHYSDGQWPWLPLDDFMTVMVNRPRDVSFVITELLDKNMTQGELLFQTLDPKRLAMSGHSIGGYAAYTLAGGDDLSCDALWPVLSFQENLPYPPNTCVPTPPDPRIDLIIPLDGASQLLRYRELARISVPSLIMGQTVENEESTPAPGLPDLRDLVARPHAAIGRPDSYRVDVDGSNHYSFTNYCDSLQVFFNLGLISAADLTALENVWPCSSTSTFQPVTISSADAHEVVTKYMIAFLDVYFGHSRKNRPILTPGYARTHTPTVDFFNTEKCGAAPRDDLYFTYRPHQLSNECDVAPKDPPGFFTPEP